MNLAQDAGTVTTDPALRSATGPQSGHFWTGPAQQGMRRDLL